MAGSRTWYRIAAVSLGLVTIVSSRLSAHDARVVGAYRLEIGWGDEPAFTGIRNSVVVEVTDAAGRTPVKDLGGGSLSAEVEFGTARIVLPLRAGFERRNEFRASLVPNRAGTYTFHITGRVKAQPIDITSTCSDRTFDCVASASDIQFPASDPTAGELAERIERSSPRADRALDSAARAQTLAIAAMGTAVLALLASAFGFAFRRRRTQGT